MRSQIRKTGIKFGVFAVVTTMLTACLIIAFGQYRSGRADQFSAVFRDISELRTGQTVRFAGVRVGTVDNITLQPDKTVIVDFDVDQNLTLMAGTRAAIRYLNLTGDRYVELTDGTGPPKPLQAGAQIPLDRTSPALDLDLLLGGLKPVVEGLNAKDVNALSASLIEIMQGEGDTVDSLLARSSSFSQALADKSQVIQEVIDQLRTTLKSLDDQGNNFSKAIDRLQKLVSALSAHRDPIGNAIDALDSGTASLADLLTRTRAPLAGTIDQLSRLAPALDGEKDRIDTALHKAPENYRKLVRLGAYGSFVNYFICSMAVRVTDLQDRTAEFPLYRQRTGRCSEN